MVDDKDIEVSESEVENLDSVTEDTSTEDVERPEVEIVDSPDVENEDALKELQDENKALQDKLLRLQAEFENFKRRTEKEKAALHKYKAQDLATELLPIVDNFERALQTDITEENKGFYDGITMVYDQLQKALDSQGIETIAALDNEFDPTLHHAVMQTDDENKPANTVVEELQKGYLLKDRVIRPAMVKVNK